MASIFPVILSGGSGTRLWPLSRATYPKQFISFFEGQRGSFLSAALGRLSEASGFEAPIILANRDHRLLVEAEAERAGLRAKAIVLEPVARNTAPAITVAALIAVRHDPNAIIVVMPSDHIVEDTALFAEGVRRAAAVAATGRLVLFGIKPSEPHTGYGYIKRGDALAGFDGVYAVERFTEKPDRATAEAYVAGGAHAWNSGIFVLDAKTYLKEIARLAPDILEAAREAIARGKDDGRVLALDEASFGSAPNISIDYAVMEKTDAAAVLPLDVGWNDVGSWASLWDVAPKDERGNFASGDVILEDASNSYVHSQGRLVAAIGVEDLIIADTPDALLVLDKGRAQDVSKIVARLKEENRGEQSRHLKSIEPWGHAEIISRGPLFRVMHLTVKPGGTLLAQARKGPPRRWIVAKGSARVASGDEERTVGESGSFEVQAGLAMKIANAGEGPLEMIEVETGPFTSAG